MHVNITIPAHNCAHLLPLAIEAALGQVHDDFSVTVVDDGSTDDTARVLEHYSREPRFAYLRLATRVGAARAKNVSIALSNYDAIAFHAPEEIPSDRKLLVQSQALGTTDYRVDSVFGWGTLGLEPGDDIDIDVVSVACDVVERNGDVYRTGDRPGVGCRPPNGALWRRRVFEELGGYADLVESDRDLLQRCLEAGFFHYACTERLLTAFKAGGRLRDAESASTQSDRPRRLWSRASSQTRRFSNRSRGETADEGRVVFGLEDINLLEASDPSRFAVQRDLPMTDMARRHLTVELHRALSRAPADHSPSAVALPS